MHKKTTTTTPKMAQFWVGQVITLYQEKKCARYGILWLHTNATRLQNLMTLTEVNIIERKMALVSELYSFSLLLSHLLVGPEVRVDYAELYSMWSLRDLELCKMIYDNNRGARISSETRKQHKFTGWWNLPAKVHGPLKLWPHKKVLSVTEQHKGWIEL